MKKLLLAFSLLLSLSLVGCSSKSEGNAGVKDVPVNEIEKAIDNDTLLPLNHQGIDAKESYIFENVKDVITEGFVNQALMNVQLQDVFVIKTTDVEKVKSAIEDYKNNALELFAGGYGGEGNATAVADSILESKGNYVYFIATSDSDAKDVEAKILEAIK